MKTQSSQVTFMYVELYTILIVSNSFIEINSKTEINDENRIQDQTIHSLKKSFGLDG